MRFYVLVRQHLDKLDVILKKKYDTASEKPYAESSGNTNAKQGRKIK